MTIEMAIENVRDTQQAIKRYTLKKEWLGLQLAYHQLDDQVGQLITLLKCQLENEGTIK